MNACARFFVFLLAGFLINPVMAAEDERPIIIFNLKNYADTPDMVHVEGILTGDGIGYKNNIGKCIAVAQVSLEIAADVLH